MFGSIEHQLEIKGIERILLRYSYQIRNKLKIELGTPINFNQLEIIANFYNVKINVMHLDVNGVLFNTTQYRNSTNEIATTFFFQPNFLAPIMVPSKDFCPIHVATETEDGEVIFYHPSL